MPSVNNSMGFWVHLTTNDDLLTVGEGYAPADTVITLQAGWNMIGWASPTHGTYSLTDLRNDNPGFATINVEMFDDAAAPYYMQDMVGGDFFFQGQAYWVWVDAAGPLALP